MGKLAILVAQQQQSSVRVAVFLPPQSLPTPQRPNSVNRCEQAGPCVCAHVPEHQESWLGGDLFRRGQGGSKLTRASPALHWGLYS